MSSFNCGQWRSASRPSPLLHAAIVTVYIVLAGHVVVQFRPSVPAGCAPRLRSRRRANVALRKLGSNLLKGQSLGLQSTGNRTNRCRERIGLLRGPSLQRRTRLSGRLHLSAAIELRQRFPDIIDNGTAREQARRKAAWTPLPPRPARRHEEAHGIDRLPATAVQLQATVRPVREALVAAEGRRMHRSRLFRERMTNKSSLAAGQPTRHLLGMYVVTEADAAAIREAYETGGELSAAVELRRRFPGITDNVKAREQARGIAGWTPLPLQPVVPLRPRKRKAAP